MDEDDEAADPTQDTLGGATEAYDDLVEDGIIESLIIIGLAAALAFLVYYRQQRQLNHQRGLQEHGRPNGNADAGRIVQQARQDIQEQDRGFFPRPEDPEFGQWVAGGVMH